MIIGYESTPVKQIVAIGRVSAEQDGEKIYFEKIEGLSSPIDFATLKECAELAKMEYFTMQQGSLFRLTKGEYDFIIDMIREENPLAVVDEIEKYDKEAFLDEVYMTEGKYDTLVAVLKNKKNIILQGAPGVGKTFAAKRLAYSIMGEKDEGRIEFVQFHQNYSYEDFMMGYKPVNDGFELKYGIFYRFCQKAANQPDKDFFFIIDEINRGNMSKIFGELLMLIERDYRGTKATLAYNGMTFSVPKNLYMLLTTDEGEYKMASFVDEQRMCRLYEKFILEYFSKHYPSLDVRASQIPWALDDGMGTMLPVMQSDITLSIGSKVLIIDAKYYTHTTQVQYNKHTLHSNNLYQIFTYVKNKDSEFGDKPHEVSGMLLYAQTEEAIQPDNTYMMSGNRISVKTLDLNCEFAVLAAQLDMIAKKLIQ